MAEAVVGVVPEGVAEAEDRRLEPKSSNSIMISNVNHWTNFIDLWSYMILKCGYVM